MDIGIVEYSREPSTKLASLFEELIFKEIADVTCKKKMALDLFDLLAFAKQYSELDQVVIIAELESDEKERNEGFFDGLGDLEIATGKNIFKAIYYAGENGEAKVEELVKTFVNYLFFPEKLGKQKTEEEILTEEMEQSAAEVEQAGVEGESVEETGET